MLIQSKKKGSLRAKLVTNMCYKLKCIVKDYKKYTSWCMFIGAFLCIVPLITVALILRRQNSNLLFTLYVDTQDEPQFVTDEKFLSLGLDSTIITEGFPHFNTSNPKLIRMLSYLSPAYLRIGGNQADQIMFSLNNNTESNPQNINDTSPDAYTLYASDWLTLNQLAKSSNISVIYDLNSLLRHEDGSWNSTNAKSMIQFSEEQGLKLDWELGNEPNSYEHKFGTYVNGTQLGKDFETLRAILNDSELYRDSLLIGPSTTRLRTQEISAYFEEFLESGVGAVGAITFHHYYFSGMNATQNEFLDPKTFDYLEFCINTVKFILNLVPGAMEKPLWLGETSTAWHGGAPGLSDRFIGSFLWLDKLGLSAKMKLSVVVRQSLFKGDYALIDNNYYPNPDWWISVIYKTVVSPKVLTTAFSGDAGIRAYAHCAVKQKWWDDGVVVFGMNLNADKGYIDVNELHAHEDVFAYILTTDSLLSQNVRLNGETLLLDPLYNLPKMEPKIIRTNRQGYLEVASHSIFFWVFKDSNVLSCQNQNRKK